MIKVYVDSNLAEASNVRNVLQLNGIKCILRNEFNSVHTAALDVRELWPQVWIVDDADEDRARALVAEVDRAPGSVGPPWRCRRCGESVDEVFGRCWNCDAERG